MNRSTTLDNAIRFIIKRAFRAGTVSRRDIVNAFDISDATATRIISDTITHRGDILDKRRQKIVPKILAKPPAFASEEALMQTLNEGGSNFLRRVGLYENELPVTYVCWTNSMPRKPGILNTITEGIRTEGYVRIIYIGMRENEGPSERVIAPLGLERMNDQWRVIAQDTGKQGHPIRTFVISRILEAEKEILKRRPPGFVHQHHADVDTSMEVTMNPRLTPLQKEVIADELGISSGTVRISRRTAFEFKRRFSNEPVSPGAVWPPLTTCKEE